MILTGFGALNKLLGKKVYTSQDQLGGPQVIALFSLGAGMSRVGGVGKDRSVHVCTMSHLCMPSYRGL